LSWWKAAAFTGWHEPDESRGSRPDLWAPRGEIPRADPAIPPAFTREDGSRVVAPRKEWYSLCVSSGLGKYELVERKSG